MNLMTAILDISLWSKSLMNSGMRKENYEYASQQYDRTNMIFFTIIYQTEYL